MASFDPWPRSYSGPERLNLESADSAVRDRCAGLTKHQAELLMRQWRIDDPQIGAWDLTAFRGLVAARDATDDPGHVEVYLGDDSLRFADCIMAAAPRGRARDVGCGSGITTCALARTCNQVMGVDISPAALAATRLTAALNSMAGRVSTANMDLRGIPREQSFNCVAANLPYVGVPAGLGYPSAGYGGPSGLQLMRQLLDLAPELLAPAAGMLLMRFQSAGGHEGPALLADLTSFAAKNGYDVAVVCDSRMPREVRAALTAQHAMALGRDRDRLEVLHAVDMQLAQAGGPEYYSGDIVARGPGQGVVSFTDLSQPSLLDTRLGRVAGVDRGRCKVREIWAMYQRRARYLPTGFWELGTAVEVRAPMQRFAALLAALNGEGRTVREIADLIFEDHFRRRQIRARMLYLTTALMINCLLDSGIIVPL